MELSLFVYPKCVNLFCIICVGLMPHPGNWREGEQNPEYEQGADEKRYLHLLKWQVSISLGWQTIPSSQPCCLSLSVFCSTKSATLTLKIQWVNNLTNPHDFLFSSSWIKCIVILIWAISLLGNLFIHFLYKRAFRLGSPKLNLCSGSALREVKLQTSETLLVAPLKILFYALSLWNDFFFFLNIGVSVCICHCTKK